MPAMTSELHWQPYTDEALAQAFEGHADALALARDLAYVAHVYDDLIDENGRPDPGFVHGLIDRLMFSVPMNPFYRQHQHWLMPVLRVAVRNWQVANVIEARGDPDQLRLSYVLRDSFIDAMITVQELALGVDPTGARPTALRLLMTDNEWPTYAAEHARNKP